MKIKEIIQALEMFAPLPLQDGFDKPASWIDRRGSYRGFVVSGRY